jgi:hypothetical protein
MTCEEVLEVVPSIQVIVFRQTITWASTALLRLAVRRAYRGFRRVRCVHEPLRVILSSRHTDRGRVASLVKSESSLCYPGLASPSTVSTPMMAKSKSNIKSNELIHLMCCLPFGKGCHCGAWSNQSVGAIDSNEEGTCIPVLMTLAQPLPFHI